MWICYIVVVIVRYGVLLSIIACLALAGCSHAPAPAAQEPGKRYAMQGVIKALDANAKTADIDAGQIGDWMGPMTMPYPVKPDADFQKLHVGDRIEATVVVNEPAYYVTDVKIVPQK